MKNKNETILAERLLKLKRANRTPSDKRTIEELRVEAEREASAYRNKEPKEQFIKPSVTKSYKKSSTKKEGDENANKDTVY